VPNIKYLSFHNKYNFIKISDHFDIISINNPKLEFLSIQTDPIDLVDLLPAQMTGILVFENGQETVLAESAVHAGEMDDVGDGLVADLAAVVLFALRIAQSWLFEGEEVGREFVLGGN
jgi:hypothetical protein